MQDSKKFKVKGLKFKVIGSETSNFKLRIQELIRVEFPLVFSLVFDEFGIVFAVVRILFFINRMTTAAVFPVAMSVVDLGVAALQETSS